MIRKLLVPHIKHNNFRVHRIRHLHILQMRRYGKSSQRSASPSMHSANQFRASTGNGSRFPMISSGQLDDSTYGANIDATSGIGSSGLMVGVCSEQGKRPYQEDEHAIRPFLGKPSGNGSATETHFFGLFDGHAGGKCSKYVASNLPDILVEDSSYASNLGIALKRSFLTTNEQFLKIADKMKLHDGSTGICAVLRGGKLVVSNVGDCRCLVISGGRAIQMSVDQKPTSIEEQKRINQLGGTVLNCMGVARVNGVLAVSRAFGNRTLKSVIRPDAEITQRDLVKDDDYLILASDGLWDVLRNKDVSDVCYGAASYGCQQIAEELVHSALIKGSMDNVTCIVVRLNGYVSKTSKLDVNDRPQSAASAAFDHQALVGAAHNEFSKQQQQSQYTGGAAAGATSASQPSSKLFQTTNYASFQESLEAGAGSTNPWLGSGSILLSRPATVGAAGPGQATDLLFDAKSFKLPSALSGNVDGLEDDDVTMVGIEKDVPSSFQQSRMQSLRDSANSSGNTSIGSKLLSSLNYQKYPAKLVGNVTGSLFSSSNGASASASSSAANGQVSSVPVSPIASPMQTISKRPMSMGGGIRAPLNRGNSFNINGGSSFGESNSTIGAQQRGAGPMSLLMDKVQGLSGVGMAGGGPAGSNLFLGSTNGYATLRRPTPQRQGHS